MRRGSAVRALSVTTGAPPPVPAGSSAAPVTAIASSPESGASRSRVELDAGLAGERVAEPLERPRRRRAARARARAAARRARPSTRRRSPGTRSSSTGSNAASRGAPPASRTCARRPPLLRASRDAPAAVSPGRSSSAPSAPSSPSRGASTVAHAGGRRVGVERALGGPAGGRAPVRRQVREPRRRRPGRGRPRRAPPPRCRRRGSRRRTRAPSGPRRARARRGSARRAERLPIRATSASAFGRSATAASTTESVGRDGGVGELGAEPRPHVALEVERLRRDRGGDPVAQPARRRAARRRGAPSRGVGLALAGRSRGARRRARSRARAAPRASRRAAVAAARAHTSPAASASTASAASDGEVLALERRDHAARRRCLRSAKSMITGMPSSA